MPKENELPVQANIGKFRTISSEGASTLSSPDEVAVSIGFNEASILNKSYAYTDGKEASITTAYQAADSSVLEQSKTYTDSAVSPKLDTSAYTAQDVLNKLLTVDGKGSNISAAFIADTETGENYGIRVLPKDQAPVSKDAHTIYFLL